MIKLIKNKLRCKLFIRTIGFRINEVQILLSDGSLILDWIRGVNFDLNKILSSDLNK